MVVIVMKKSKFQIFFLLLAAVLFFCITSSRPYHIKHSTVHTYETSTETDLYIVTNRPIWFDQSKLAENIVSEQFRLNRPAGKVTYQLYLYQTEWHYQNHVPYATLTCDQDGRINP